LPTVETIYTATDETGGAIESARSGAVGLRKDITATGDAYDSYSDQLRATGPVLRDNQRLQRLSTLGFKQQHEVLFDSIDVVSGIGHGFLKLTSIFTAYNTLQTRVGDQEERLHDAQEKTLEAVARYGANSQQAIKARKAEQKEQEKLNRVNQEGQLQMVGLGVAGLSMASDFTHVLTKVNKLRYAIGTRGGLGSIIGNVFGGGTSLAAGVSPLAGARGGISRGTLLRGAALGGGITLATAGIAGTLQDNKTFNDKLTNVISLAGSGALLGAALAPATLGLSIPIGAAAGAIAGLATNFNEEFGNLFTGKGFVPNSQLVPNLTGGGVNMQGSNIYIYTNSIADANQLKAQLEAEARKNQ